MKADKNRAFRDALGRFATGVTVVTALDSAGLPIGMTANSFSSVSLDPPLVLWSLDKSTPRFSDYCNASHYAISVLAADQIDISQRFASGLDDKFSGLSWHHGVEGVPILANMHTIFQCVNRHHYEGGDHVILVGEVLEFEQHYAEPLLFVGGRYATARGHPASTRVLGGEPTQSASGRFIDDYLPYLIGRASFLINRQFNDRLQAVDVKPSTWRILASLVDDGMAFESLSEVVLIRPEALRVHLADLERAGLVERCARQPGSIAVTEQGRQLVGDLLEAAKIHEEQVLGECSYEQRVELKRTLDQVIHHIACTST